MNGVWIPLGLAGLDWLGLRLGLRRLEPLTKPAVMAGILAWMLLQGPVFGTPAAWFFAGITFSLIGDILLLPALDRFKPALAAYLLAVLAYTAGLNTTPFPVNFSTALFAIAVALPAWRVQHRIAAGLSAAGRTGLKFPVRIYIIAVSLALLSALATLAKEAWPPIPALLAGGGALLLAGSAVILAWDRFVEPLPGAALKFRAAYHLGQIALVAGAVLFV